MINTTPETTTNDETPVIAKTKSLKSMLEKRMQSASLEEIEDLAEQLNAMRAQLLADQKTEALERIKQIVLENDLTYEEVHALIRTDAKRGKAVPKYRNPDNPRVTWSGRGRPPEWYTTHPDPESLLITD